MLRIDFLEKQYLVEHALPPLARRYGVDKTLAWEILENNLEKIKPQVIHPDVEVHFKVQEWFRKNSSKLSELGLNVFKNNKPKASHHNYPQLICIVLLNDLLHIKNRTARSNQSNRYRAIQNTPQKLPWYMRLYYWWLKFKAEFV